MLICWGHFPLQISLAKDISDSLLEESKYFLSLLPWGQEGKNLGNGSVPWLDYFPHLGLKTHVYNEHIGHFTVLPLKSRAYIVTTCCTMHTVCTAVYGFMFTWVPAAYRYIGLLYVLGKYKNMLQYFLMLRTTDRYQEMF